MRQHQRRGGVAGNNDEIGTVGLNQLGHESADARDEFRLAVTAIGKESVVRDIDVTRVGSRLRDFAKNGQPAQPRVEHEDGCWHELS